VNKGNTGMATEVRLPELAESMKSARVAAWLKHEGERVTAGEPLLELETDKTNVEVESP
jgi:pyruvate/2-oxoglutarate dehydrogenase complex dihydrolipoamide acyltransferase (E2) component